MDNSRQITIVIADDHPIVLCGLRALLTAHSDLKLLRACSTGTAALRAIRELDPDVAVLDVSMPDIDGLTVLANAGCYSRVVLLTATASDSQLLTAVLSGVGGIVLKEESADVLVSSIREVAAGRHWFPADLIRNNGQARRESPLLPDGRDPPLTTREREVAMLVSEGLSNKEVGRRLNLTEGTVKIHLHKIYDKVGVSNRTALAARAFPGTTRF